MGRMTWRSYAVLDGLRGRVVLMGLLTAAPLLALLVAAGLLDRGQALQAASARARDLARLATTQQMATIDETARMLRLLTLVPDVRAIVPGVCDRDLSAAAARAAARGTRITILRPDGTVACSSWQAAPHPNVGDRAYFRRALAAGPDAPPTVELVASRLTDAPVLIVAQRLPAGETATGGVIVASIGIDWLAGLAAQVPGPTRRAAVIVDTATDTVLGRSPPAPGTAATRPGRRLRQALARGGTGSIMAANWDGLPMVFGFAPLPAGGQTLMLAVGMARQDVLASANRHLWLGGAVALAAILAAAMLAAAAGRMLVLRPIEALAAAVDRLGAGDLAARVPTDTPTGELRVLGGAFNRMALNLETRTQELVATQAELARSEAHHRLLADNLIDMITLLGPDFRRRYVSPACRDLLGYAAEELVGVEPGGIVHPDDWILLDATLNQPLRNGQERARATYRAIRKDGSCVWLESSGRRLPDGTGYVVVTRDVSERKAFEEQLEAANRRLEELAAQDPLTGLANRRRFEQMLDIEHRRSRRLGLSVSVVIIDADRFKGYNDRYGHPAGDGCLRAVAAAIDGVLRRPGDLAARLGGEEFAVLLPATDETGAAHMANRIRDAVRALAIPHADNEAGIVTVSLGVASVFPRDGMDAAALVAMADQALYAAKRGGRDAVRFGHA